MNKLIKIVLSFLALILLITIAGIIFVNVWSHKQTDNPNSQTNQALLRDAQDAQRKNAFGEIWGAAQTNKQQTGYYPTLAVINTSTFQSQYHLSSMYLKDPVGNTTVLASSPARGVYAYEVTGNSDAICNNTTVYCTNVKVIATLNNGSYYSYP